MYSNELTLLVIAAMAGVGMSQEQRTTLDDAGFSSEAVELMSHYIPPSAYAQLTASVAAAASAASVTGDPASLLFSAILTSSPPAWFSSAVPPYFSSNVASLEHAIADIRPSTTQDAGTAPGAYSSETVVVTSTTDSNGNIVATSFTSTLPTVTSTPNTSTSNGVAPTAVAMQLAGAGIAAIVGLVVAL